MRPHQREIAWTSEKDLLSALRTQKLDLRPSVRRSDPIAERRAAVDGRANAFALAPRHSPWSMTETSVRRGAGPP